MLIDTHCHIDLYPDPKEVISKSETNDIITIGMTNLPSHFKLGYPHVKNQKRVRLSIGLHPLMAETHSKEMLLFTKYLDMTSYVGEVGLDFSKEGISTKAIQIRSFDYVLKAVSRKKKILSVHSRGAEKEVLKMLQINKIENAIFHWYTGGLKLIDEIVQSGYYFSINTAMMNSAKGQKIINRIPKENILTESDGPFINHNNRVVDSSDISFVVDYLNKVFKATNMEKQIVLNFMKLINRIK